MGLGVAFRAFFAALFDKSASTRIAAALAGEIPAAPAADPGKDTPAPARDPGVDPRAAYVVLSGLQTEGRLIDFLMEDIEDADDADIGVAVREVHRGCRDALEKLVDLAPIRDEPEGEDLSVDDGYNPAELRIVGAAGSPPFKGTLRHRGWRVTRAHLPTLTGDAATHEVIAPAELETE